VLKVKNKLVLVLILFLAAILRLVNTNWDQGNFLHPDERFLNMAVQELKLPNSLGEYLNQEISGLNPRNYGKNFFVYGNLAPSLNKLVSSLLRQDSLEEITITGRVLSALADLMIIPIIYLAVLLLEKNLKGRGVKIAPNTKLWASLIYALSVLPIQQAHFFTTDTFLNLFVFASFYFSLQFFFKKKLYWLILSGFCLGLAIASKISGIFILPLNLSIITLNYFWPFQLQFSKKNVKKTLLRTSKMVLIFGLSTYLSLRLASPYLFANSSFFKIALSPDFINNLKELKTFENNEVWFPPAVQWMNRSSFFGLYNLIIFGFGIVASVFTFLGIRASTKKIISLFKKTKKQKQLLTLVFILVWMGGFFIYYSQQFVQSIRYYLIVYPFLAILAGFGITTFFTKPKTQWLWTSIVICLLILWPLMFISIYLKPHSRIRASEWIYQNIPNESLILTEHWDDALPIGPNESFKYYKQQQLPVFAPDNNQKWLEINLALSEADYYILSSNRAWASIIRVPEKYPQMSEFYQNLLNGQSSYQLIAEFNSYPGLEYLGIPISLKDSWADEAFTVYDHPQVLIFKKIDDHL
jgi:hypothetical protein